MRIQPAEAKHILDTEIQRGQAERRDWDRWHGWYLGEFWADRNVQAPPQPDGNGDDLDLESNFPYAFIDTMIANVCPQNPMMTITAERSDDDDSARAREALINDTFRRNKLHAIAWDLAIFTSICGTGWTKTIWSEQKRRPITTVINPRNIFYDRSNAWEDARYVIEAIPLTKAEFQARVAAGKYTGPAVDAVHFGRMPMWLSGGGARSHLDNASREAFEWTLVYEFYDLESGNYMHMLEGVKEPLAVRNRPYLYVRNPYDQLIFNNKLIYNAGISDVKLIERPQERLNEIDSLELWFAHTSIPIMIMNEAMMDNPEEAATSIQNATGPGMIVRFKGKNEVPVDAVFGYTKPPGITPSFAVMRERCQSLIEFTLGLPQYSRGVIGQADVATEVALADTERRTRNGRRIKIIEDWVSSVGMKTLGLWKQKLDPSRVIYLRGQDGTQELERGSLAFPMPDDTGKLPDQDFEDEWFYRYEAAPYSPAENHRLVQLQKLQQFLELLNNNPRIDQDKLMGKVTELLGMKELRQAAAAPAQPGMQPAVSSPPAHNGLPGGAQDTIATGAVPGQLDEAVLPPGARQLADQPQV